MISVTPDRNSGVPDLKIVQSLHILAKSEIVQKSLDFSIYKQVYLEVNEYWSRYTIQEILQQHGVPDQIVMTIPAPGERAPLLH